MNTTIEKNDNRWFLEPCKSIDDDWLENGQNHQNNLTKPQGALGRLEEVAISFCAFQKTLNPSLDKITVRVYAGDHGVCAQNISAFPQAVTAQMVDNFCQGGAAISVLSNSLEKGGASVDFAVVNMGTANTPSSEKVTTSFFVQEGTNDFSQQEAMSANECLAALAGGANSIELGSDIFVGGEMGIGNTTSASALLAVLLDLEASVTVGPGTGLDSDGVIHKANIIEKSIALHKPKLTNAFNVLQCLGGFEIAALSGAYIRCAQQGIPVVVDGFISAAAALVAAKLNPGVMPWFIFSHMSAEPGHIHTLDYFNAKPLLDLGMRLGEGSGAATAVSLINTALDLHNNMASFTSAGVSESN